MWSTCGGIEDLSTFVVLSLEYLAREKLAWNGRGLFSLKVAPVVMAFAFVSLRISAKFSTDKVHRLC